MAFTIRNLKIRNQILLVSLPPLFVLLCAVGLAFYAYGSVISTERAALRSKDSVTRNESFFRHVTEAAMAVGEYASTRQPAVLAPYEKAVADSLADLNALSELEAADPAQLRELARIRSEFEEMQNSWALPTIETVRAGRDYDVTRTILEGQERLNAIRAEGFKLQSEEGEGQNVNEMVVAEKVVRRMLAVGVGLAVLLAGILVFLTGLVTRLWSSRRPGGSNRESRRGSVEAKRQAVDARVFEFENDVAGEVGAGGGGDRNVDPKSACLRDQVENVAAPHRIAAGQMRCRHRLTKGGDLIEKLQSLFGGSELERVSGRHRGGAGQWRHERAQARAVSQ